MDAVEAFQECLLLVASILTLAYIGHLTFGAALSDCLFKLLNRIYDLIAMPAVHMPLVRISMGIIVMGLLLFAVQSVVFCFQLFFCRDPDEAPVNSAKRPLYEQEMLTLSWNVQKTTNIEKSRAWRIPLPLINEEEINRLADTAVNTTVHNRYSIGDSIEWTSRLPATGPSVDASSMAQRNTKPSTSPGRTFTFPLYEDDGADESEEKAKESTSAENPHVKGERTINFDRIHDVDTILKICCESEGDFRGLDAIRRACELGDMHRDERIEGDDLEGLIAHFQRQLKEYDTVGVLIKVAYDAVRHEDFDGGSDSEIDLDEIRDLGALQEK